MNGTLPSLSLFLVFSLALLVKEREMKKNKQEAKKQHKKDKCCLILPARCLFFL